MARRVATVVEMVAMGVATVAVATVAVATAAVATAAVATVEVDVAVATAAGATVAVAVATVAVATVAAAMAAAMAEVDVAVAMVVVAMVAVAMVAVAMVAATAEVERAVAMAGVEGERSHAAPRSRCNQCPERRTRTPNQGRRPHRRRCWRLGLLSSSSRSTADFQCCRSRRNSKR